MILKTQKAETCTTSYEKCTCIWFIIEPERNLSFGGSILICNPLFKPASNASPERYITVCQRYIMFSL